jgi:acyl-CoA thioesterase-1
VLRGNKLAPFKVSGMYRKAGVYTLLIVIVCVACLYWGGIPRKGSAPKIDVNRQPAPVTYIAFGDSTGIGLGARNGGGYVDRLLRRIQQTRPDARLINLCAAGATTADVLNKQISRFPKDHVTLVTIAVGTNDLMQGVDEDQFLRNYDEIISRLREADVPIIVTNLPDIVSAPALAQFPHEALRSRVELFNELIKSVANRHDVLLVDLYQAYGKTSRSRPDFFSADGFHPSDIGYEFWAEAMWPAVEKSIR